VASELPQSSPVIVRAAQPADLAALLSLYHEFAEGRADAEPADVVTSARVLDDVLADPRRQLLVATFDGRVAGSVDLLVVPNPTHRGKPWAVVENVIVAGAYRRAGVGRGLMKYAIEHARAAGCYKIQLTTSKQRTPAHAFYRSLGFDSVAEGYKIYFR
jgi:ribosomal protein S18 acetylase RimI-like enzyme